MALLACISAGHAAPGNDNFSSAHPLGSSWTSSHSGTLQDATSEASGNEPDLSEWAALGWEDDLTVWYQWTAPPGATWARAIVSGINFPNTISVYTGGTLGTLHRLRGNDRGIATPNRTTFPVNPGTTYFLRVSAVSSAPWELPWYEVPVYDFDLSFEAISSPITADDHVLRGRGHLETGSPQALVQARDDFSAAVAIDADHEEAGFLLGLAELFSLEGETAFAETLAGLGIPLSGSFRDGGYSVPEDPEGRPIFADAADTRMAIDWLNSRVLPKLEAAETALGRVTSASFRSDITTSETGGVEFEVDAGDALVIKAGTHALEMLVHFLSTYDLSVPLEGLVELDREGGLSAERVLEIHSSLLGFSSTDRRSELASALEALAQDYEAASDFIRMQRTGPGGLLSAKLSEDPEMENDLRTHLAQAVASLDLETEINGRRTNLSAFLGSASSLKDWMPAIRGHHVAGSFPDSTFGGIFPDNTNVKMEGRMYELGRLWGMSQYTAELGEWLSFLGLPQGPSEDADGDGTENFAEWIFGSDPLLPDTVYQEVIPPDAAGGGEVKFSHIRASNLVDWDLVVLVSDDMSSWDDTGLSIEPVGDPVPNGDGVTETVTYRLVSGSALPDRKFFRVEARPKP